jgi:hypothetical protein
MGTPPVRQALEGVRHRLAVLNGNCVTRDPSVIDTLRWEEPAAVSTIDGAAYDSQLDRALGVGSGVSVRTRAVLERARRMMADLHGMTFVESGAIERRSWLVNVTWLDFDRILDDIDIAVRDHALVPMTPHQPAPMR